MTTPASLYLFHLYLPNGHAVFLHDITPSSTTPKALESRSISAHYGRDPDPALVGQFRGQLHGDLAEATMKECADQKFPLRLALSAAGFLSVFLLFIVVFKASPVFLKLLAAIFFGIFTYVAILRRECSAARLRGRAEKLCKQVDSVVFLETPFLLQVENSLRVLSAMSNEDMLKYALAGKLDLEPDEEVGAGLALELDRKRRRFVSARLYKKVLRGKRLSGRDWKELEDRCSPSLFPVEVLCLLVYLQLHHSYSEMTCSSSRIDSSSR